MTTLAKISMNKILSFIFLLSTIIITAQDTAKTHNIILVTWDGYRWQEVFKGAEKKLINSKKLVRDVDALRKNYWTGDNVSSREKLLRSSGTPLLNKAALLAKERTPVK